MKTYRLIIEKNKDGFWGRIDKLDSVYSQGESVEDLKVNIQEAIDLYYDAINKQKPKYDIELVMDIQEFFEVNNYINVSTLAERIGMNASLLRQYSKGLKFPGLAQVGRIENAIRQIGEELSRTELQAH